MHLNSQRDNHCKHTQKYIYNYKVCSRKIQSVRLGNQSDAFCLCRNRSPATNIYEIQKPYFRRRPDSSVRKRRTSFGLLYCKRLLICLLVASRHILQKFILLIKLQSWISNAELTIKIMHSMRRSFKSESF